MSSSECIVATVYRCLIKVDNMFFFAVAIIHAVLCKLIGTVKLEASCGLEDTEFVT